MVFKKNKHCWSLINGVLLVLHLLITNTLSNKTQLQFFFFSLLMCRIYSSHIFIMYSV